MSFPPSPITGICPASVPVLHAAAVPASLILDKDSSGMSCSSSGFNDVSIDMSLLPSKVVFPVMAPANVTARAVLSLSAESALSTYPVLAPASLSVLEGTYDKEKFVATLKGKGIDTVLRYTEEGRIYGTTFIDHRTGCVLNGSRMGKELSANALQEHFTLPYAGQPPISLSVPVEEPENRQGYSDSKNVMLWYIIDV